MGARALATLGVRAAAAMLLAITALKPHTQGTGRFQRTRTHTSIASTSGASRASTFRSPSLATQGNETTGRLATLPSWFVSSRVHLNTGAQTKMFNPEAVAARAASLGATVVTMTVKEKAGDPAWPSAVPAAASAPRAQPNRVEPVVAALHRRGIRFIGYYFASADRTIARKMPNVVCHDRNGKPLPYKKKKGFKNAFWLDITAPEYREIIKQRLLEMAAMGVDGYNFDESHLPLGGCYGTSVEQAFREETGRSAPAGGRRDADRAAYLAFQSRRVQETFAYWQQAVHQQYPNVVFVVSTHALARALNFAVHSDFARVVDVQKNEVTMPLRNGQGVTNLFARRPQLGAPDAAMLLGFGWAWLRDAADGRPSRLWHTRFDDEGRAAVTAEAVVAYGAILALALDADDLKRATAMTWQRRVFQFGKKIASYIDGPPIRWAAVQFSEAARDSYGSNQGRAWKEAVGPAVAAFGAFVRQGAPVAVLADEQVDDSHLNDYHILALTRPDVLTSAERAAVERFRQRGGVVIDIGAITGSGNFESAIDGVRAQIASVTNSAPISFASDTGTRAHVIGYADAAHNRWVVAVLNDFASISTLTPDGNRRNIAPARATNVSIVLRGSSPVKRAYDLLTGARINVSRSGAAPTLNLQNLSRAAYVVVEF